MKPTYIVSSARTALGSFQGSLSPLRTPDIGGIAIKAAVERGKIKPSDVDHCIMGCVLPAGLGQAPARQAMFAAGLPKEVDALTINKVCSSGLFAITMADQLIRLGEAQVAVAGGMESMTNAPYVLPNARSGYRMGDGKIVDVMVKDGLWDHYTNQHMGSCAELCAKTYGVTRKDQDEFAIDSYKKAIAAVDGGLFKEEIVPVVMPQKKGDPVIFEKDEEPHKAKFDRFPTLPTPFAKDGTVTPANASSVSDGAAALLLMSEDKVKSFGAKPVARVVASGAFSREPEWFTMAPVGAIRNALAKAGLKPEQIDLWEINEAFSVVTIMAMREFNIDPKKVNICGGAVALGHPIGASGARIVTTLLHNLKRTGKKVGLATLCNGGGEATAIIVESV